MNARTIGWLFGGVCCAAGILTMMFSWDSGGADIALSLDRVGWDAVENVGPNGNFSDGGTGAVDGRPDVDLPQRHPVAEHRRLLSRSEPPCA